MEWVTEGANRRAKGSTSLLHLTKRQVSFAGKKAGLPKGRR